MSNELALLLNLIPYPKTTLTTVDKPSISENLIQQYVSVTESIAKNLIANLTEPNIVKNVDLHFIINISNAAFASLSSLQVDYRKLYDAVKDYIRFKCQLSDAKKEYENQVFLSSTGRLKIFKARMDLVIALNALEKAREDKNTVEETFSKRLDEANAKIEDLSVKCIELKAEHIEAVYDFSETGRDKVLCRVSKPGV